MEFQNRHLDRYADVLIWGLETSRKKAYRKNDIILVRFQPQALPLAEVLYSKLLRREMQPIMRLVPSASMEKSLYQYATKKQITFHPPGETTLYEKLNGSIYLLAPVLVE